MVEPLSESVGAAQPVQPDERFELLDVLRGFALFGILIANMPVFSGQDSGALAVPGWDGLPDRAAVGFTAFFVLNKFYSLFSLLFGLGFALQLARAERRGVSLGRLYGRRLWSLFGIGVLHGVFLWFGDILTLYALAGLALLGLSSRPTPALWRWVIGGVVTGAVLLGLVLALGATTPGNRVELERAFSAYANGDFARVTAIRAADYFTATVGALFFGFTAILSIFLLGLMVGRARVLENLSTRRSLLSSVFGSSLGPALVFNLALLLSRSDPAPLAAFVSGAAGVLGGLAGCLVYASGLALLWTRPGWRSRLALLAAPGRMALSNYLGQSLVCTLVFYGYGLGFYGRVGPALGLGLALLIYAAQVLASRLWLARFAFGPAEWLWRSLTYGRLQPMRGTADRGAAGQGRS